MSESPLFTHLKSLATEQRNEQSLSIDQASTLQILQIINGEDQKVAEIISHHLEKIDQAVDKIVEAFLDGGRLIYIGSGTSGRIGVVDAAECPPTFGTPPEMVQGIIAGGEKAMFVAQEGVEDSREEGAEALKRLSLHKKDVVCGLAASGRTPYVLGGLEEARNVGATTVFICCVPRTQLQNEDLADILIDIPVGAEVIMGSTRMKSASAQKMVCNMITTTSMIKLGKVYENVMVDLQLNNEKLVERAKRIIMHFVECSYAEAGDLLSKSGNHVKTAIIVGKTDISVIEAKQLLEKNDGFVHKVLEQAIN